MRRISQTWIRTETSEKLTIKRVISRPERLQCASCVEEVAVATLSESKRLVQMTAREIFRQADRGVIHIMENAEDEPMVCLISLYLAYRALDELPKLNEGTSAKGETK
jgi:hypothetical protein